MLERLAYLGPTMLERLAYLGPTILEGLVAAIACKGCPN